MNRTKENQKSHPIPFRHACINCIHCHLFHQEKNNNRYYCQPPGRTPLFISCPYMKQYDPCEHYVLQHHILSPVVTRLCNKILDELLKHNIGNEEFDYTNSFLSKSLSHDPHLQLYDILEEIIEWEKELTDNETTLSIRFYFELASHAVMKIIHLQGGAAFNTGKIGSLKR